MVNRNFLTPRNGMPYQTIGSLMINFPDHGNVTDYYRELDLGKAIITVSYKADGVTYTRELFSSIADNVIIMRISSSEPGKLSCNLSFNCPLELRSLSRTNPFILGLRVMTMRVFKESFLMSIG